MKHVANNVNQAVENVIGDVLLPIFTIIQQVTWITIDMHNFI